MEDRTESPPPMEVASAVPSAVSHKTRRLLYISHFLSTWNARVFEFGAYLFLAKIYPGTLLPASVYALSRAASAALLSNIVGRLVDTGDRLRVIRISIGKHHPPMPAKCLVS